MLGDPDWYNYLYDHVAAPGYTPMLFALRQDRHFKMAVMLAYLHPEQLWLVSNEPENSGADGGSDVSPQEAAEAAARWCRETSGPWAGVGVLWGPRGKLWIQDYLSAGGPIPDIWHLHIYAWTAEHWRQQWDEWQEYIDWTSIVAPTIVTECAAWAIEIKVQRAVMDEVRRTLDIDDNLAGAYWFSSRYGQQVDFWRRADLLDDADKLTGLGKHYAGTVVYLPDAKTAVSVS
jgi:hypothetical protein